MDSQTISVASSILFIACSVIQIYVTMRIAKIEKTILDEVRKEIQEATKDIVTQRELDREISHLKELIKKA